MPAFKLWRLMSKSLTEQFFLLIKKKLGALIKFDKICRQVKIKNMQDPLASLVLYLAMFWDGQRLPLKYHLYRKEWRTENYREQKEEKFVECEWRALVMYVLPAVIE